MEAEAIQLYLQEHHIEDIVLELTESLLKEKPLQPKKWLLGKLEEEIGDGHSRNSHSGTIIDVPSQLFESTRSITAEIVPKETINIIIAETAKLLVCDRVSLFVYNPKIKMLILTASNL
eukprot:g9245.t1